MDNGHRFAGDILKLIYLNEKYCSPIRISF